MKQNYVPKVGEMYYYPLPSKPELVNYGEFYDSNISNHRTNNGLCYPPTDEGYSDAIIHAIYLLGASNMELQTLKAFKTSLGSVIIYGGGKQLAFYPPEYTNKPTKRSKHITLNCFKFKLEWMN